MDTSRACHWARWKRWTGHALEPLRKTSHEHTLVARQARCSSAEACDHGLRARAEWNNNGLASLPASHCAVVIGRLTNQLWGNQISGVFGTLSAKRVESGRDVTAFIRETWNAEPSTLTFSRRPTV
jgi:hypothetical protein